MSTVRPVSQTEFVVAGRCSFLMRVCALMAAMSCACSGVITGEVSGSPSAAGNPVAGSGAGTGVADAPSAALGSGEGDAKNGGATGGGAAPAKALRRLTREQYANTVRDVLGVEADVGEMLALSPLNGLRSIAASRLSMAEVDVENAMALSGSVSSTYAADVGAVAAALGCELAQETCLHRWLDTTGRRLFRRALSDAERTRYRALFTAAMEVTGEVATGIELITAAMLQSPYFLYRVELSPGPTGSSLDAYGLASRLSFFLWNTGPDDALLDAAASGALLDEAGLTAQVERMLASPRVEDGIRSFFQDWLELDELERMSKLADAFPQASAELSAAMREETLRFVAALSLEQDADARTLFTGRDTFVNDRLADLYGLGSPGAADFVATRLADDGARSGLLTQASFLALHAHPGTTSPTLRGRFIREKFLCQAVPSPPPNVNITLPDASVAPTARERLTQHREEPSCAGCHKLMDPLGLALEQFDAIGAFRTEENGVEIDPSGELDGTTFQDARGLGEALAEEPAAMACLATTMLRYARGSLEVRGEAASLSQLQARFAAQGFSILGLLRVIATSPGFRAIGEE